MSEREPERPIDPAQLSCGELALTITVGLVLTGRTTVRRLRVEWGLRRDLHEGIVVVRVVSDPVASECTEWLPVSGENWTMGRRSMTACR